MPTPTVRKYLIGKNCSLSITGMTDDPTTGVLTADTSLGVKSFVGKCDRIESNYNPRVEEISPMDANLENDVPLKERWEVSVTELQYVTGCDLEYLISNYQYFMLVLIAGAKKKTYYLTKNRGTITHEMGRNPANFTFGMADVGSGINNPTIVAFP